MRRPVRGRRRTGKAKGLGPNGESDTSSSTTTDSFESTSGDSRDEAAQAKEEEALEKKLRLQMETLKELPKASRYARHRIPIVEKCLSMLSIRKRTRNQESQLEKLLSRLDIRRMDSMS